MIFAKMIGRNGKTVKTRTFHNICEMNRVKLKTRLANDNLDWVEDERSLLDLIRAFEDAVVDDHDIGSSVTSENYETAKNDLINRISDMEEYS